MSLLVKLLCKHHHCFLSHCHPSFLESVFALWYDISHKSPRLLRQSAGQSVACAYSWFSNVTNIGNIVTIIGNIVKLLFSDSIGFFLFFFCIYILCGFLTEKSTSLDAFFWELTKINSCTNFRVSFLGSPVLHNGASQQINKTPLWGIGTP